MSLLGTLHGDLVFKRGTRVLSARLVDLLPHGATVLDAGCGDGLIDKLIGERRPDLPISGTDIDVHNP
jgi:methylase of polypeptide subunit release factors